MFISLQRIIIFAAQNFWRNIWLSLVTVTMLVLTLISVNILVVLHVVGETAIAAVEERVDVTASLVRGVSQETVSEIRSYLLSLKQVESVLVVTPEEALESFRKRHAGNPDIIRSLDEVDGNPFGPTLIIRAKLTQDYPFILEALENPTYRSYIQEKNFTDHEAIIERLSFVIGRLRQFGLILAVIFASIATLVVVNTIRVAIYTYREEIGIMKLVGASSWFIRAPFLVEGILYSLVAVAVTAVVVFPMLGIIEPYLQAFFEGTRVGLVDFFRREFLTVFGSEFVALAVLNTASSSLAVGRYLK